MEHRSWINRDDGGVDRQQLGETIEEGAGHPQPDAHPLRVAHIGECGLDLLAQVPRDPIRCLSRSQVAHSGWRAFA